jgi:hypothetical protein
VTKATEEDYSIIRPALMNLKRQYYDVEVRVVNKAFAANKDYA